MITDSEKQRFEEQAYYDGIIEELTRERDEARRELARLREGLDGLEAHNAYHMLRTKKGPVVLLSDVRAMLWDAGGMMRYVIKDAYITSASYRRDHDGDALSFHLDVFSPHAHPSYVALCKAMAQGEPVAVVPLRLEPCEATAAPEVMEDEE